MLEYALNRKKTPGCHFKSLLFWLLGYCTSSTVGPIVGPETSVNAAQYPRRAKISSKGKHSLCLGKISPEPFMGRAVCEVCSSRLWPSWLCEDYSRLGCDVMWFNGKVAAYRSGVWHLGVQVQRSKAEWEKKCDYPEDGGSRTPVHLKLHGVISQ